MDNQIIPTDELGSTLEFETPEGRFFYTFAEIRPDIDLSTCKTEGLLFEQTKEGGTK